MDNNSKISYEVVCEHESECLNEEGADPDSKRRVTVRCDAYGRWKLRWWRTRHHGVREHQANTALVHKTDHSVIGRPRRPAVDCMFLFTNLRTNFV